MHQYTKQPAWISDSDIMNLELIRQLEAENKNFALVSAHYNNWEWMIFFPSQMKHKFLVIYRPLTE